jgi:hypothetical protein
MTGALVQRVEIVAAHAVDPVPTGGACSVRMANRLRVSRYACHCGSRPPIT